MESSRSPEYTALLSPPGVPPPGGGARESLDLEKLEARELFFPVQFLLFLIGFIAFPAWWAGAIMWGCGSCCCGYTLHPASSRERMFARANLICATISCISTFLFLVGYGAVLAAMFTAAAGAGGAGGGGVPPRGG